MRTSARRFADSPVALAASIFVVAEVAIAWIGLASRPALVGALVPAVIADVGLVSGGALAYLAWRAGSLSALELTPRRALRAASLGALVWAVAVLAGAPRAPAFAGAALEVIVIGAALISIVHVYRARASATLEERDDLFNASVRSILPTPVAELLLFELAIMGAASRAVLRRPIRVENARAGVAFAPLAGSSYPLVVGVLVGLSLVELGLAHVILHALLGGGHATAHAILAGVHGYGILWLVGDARALGESRHLVCESELVLQLGLRGAATVPIASISGARVLDPNDDTRDASTIRLTPLEPPNVELALTRPAIVIGLFNRKRHARRLRLYVDRPSEFVESIKISGI